MYREQERPLRQALLSFRNRKNAGETGKKSLEMTILFYIEVGNGKRQIFNGSGSGPSGKIIMQELNGIPVCCSVPCRKEKHWRQREPPCRTCVICALMQRICRKFLEKGEVKGIYLNFSDPWPKDRHAKRRLTSRQFLKRYDEILAADGKIEFKTDNRALFEFH